MASRDESWRLGESGFGLRFGPFALSFQRFALPASGLIERLPSSLGAMHVGISRAGALLLPVADDEAFWIGISSDQGAAGSVEVVGRHRDGSDFVLTATAAILPPDRRIAGLTTPDGRLAALARTDHAGAPGILDLAISARLRSPMTASAGARIDLVDYRSFTDFTSQPPPERLDARSAYSGNLLP